MHIIFIIAYCAYLILEKLYNLGTNQDITELKREIRTLRKQKKKRRTPTPPAP